MWPRNCPADERRLLWGCVPQGAAWRPSSGSMSSCVGVCQCLYKSDAQLPKMSPPTVLSSPCLCWGSGVRGSICSRQEDGPPVLWLDGRFCLGTCLYLVWVMWHVLWAVPLCQEDFIASIFVIIFLSNKLKWLDFYCLFKSPSFRAFCPMC